MEPAGGLGEERLAGMESAEVGDGLVFEMDFDTGTDGVARGGFSVSGEVEGEEV